MKRFAILTACALVTALGACAGQRSLNGDFQLCGLLRDWEGSGSGDTLPPPPDGMRSIAIDGQLIRCGDKTYNHQPSRVVEYIDAVSFSADGTSAEIYTSGGSRLPNGLIMLISGNRCAFRRTDHGWLATGCATSWEF